MSQQDEASLPEILLSWEAVHALLFAKDVGKEPLNGFRAALKVAPLQFTLPFGDRLFALVMDELRAGDEWTSRLNKQRSRTKLIARLLERAGFEPVLVSNAAEALRGGDLALWRHLHDQIGRLVYLDRRIVMVPMAKQVEKDLKLVFVCGLHRSGTTVLGRLLGACLGSRTLKAEVPMSEGQFLQTQYPTDNIFGGPGRFAFAAEMRPRRIEDPEQAKEIRKNILRRWASTMQGDGDILLEKSPPNLTKIDYLRSIFPGAKFIIWARDPRAVSHATVKWSGTTIAELMMHWHVAYSQAVADIGEDCIVARYEDLCADPKSELQRILNFLGKRVPGKAIDENLAKFPIDNRNGQYFAEYQPGESRVALPAWRYFGYEF